MRRPRIRATLAFVGFMLLNLLRLNGFAGGSGLNVLVVVNQASSNSVEVGNYYCRRRGVPPQNLLRINWTGGNTTWALSDFQSVVLDPLESAIAQRGLAGQIRYVALSMDIPFAITDGLRVNSITSSLFYGFKNDTKGTENSYARSEGAFGEQLPNTAPTHSYLTTMITAGSLQQAKTLIDQGVNSDGTFPTQAVLLAKSSDPLRNQRYRFFNNAIFSTRLAGYNTVQWIDSDVVSGRSGLLGYQTGLAHFSISPETFVPGAMADSMTSFGGIIFGPNSQTSLLAFIHAGASGSYGTVIEPGAIVSKFPDPMVYFYQARGFSLAECYYQGVEFPFQGLVVGEPLAAPYCRPATGGWVGVASNTVLSSVQQLSVEFHSVPDVSLQRVDLFIDGRYVQTLTNLPPAPGNQLTLGFVGGTVDYTVPPGATLTSLAAALASKINSVAASNPAHIQAKAHGDRIEVQSLSGSRPRPPGVLVLSAQASSATGTALAGTAIGTATSLTTFLTAARESSLESSALGIRTCTVTGTPQAGSWLRLGVTKTNGTIVTVGVTNQSGGNSLLQFADELSARVHSASDLQETDGVQITELSEENSSLVTFSLQPRAPGYAAAGLQFSLTASPELAVAVTGNDLRENLDDLLPRNHIYVRAGATNLVVTVPLDTTVLADGYHELSAVAYEGSHVRTQTRATLPVRIQNTSLSAILTLPGVSNPAPVAGTQQAEVVVNENPTAAIRLFSTGGQLDEITGQSSAVFTLDGATLGAGMHPVWAEVESADGRRYRTEPHWLHLSNTP